MRGCSQYTCLAHKLFCYLGYIGYFETDQISKNQSKNLDHFDNLQSLLMRNKGVWYCSDIVALVCWPRWECYRKVRQLNNDLVRQLPTNWLHTATTSQQLYNSLPLNCVQLQSCWLDFYICMCVVSSQLVRWYREVIYGSDGSIVVRSGHHSYPATTTTTTRIHCVQDHAAVQ